MNPVADNHSSVLPHALYRAAQVRELDRIAIEEQGIPGATLMQRAGEAAFASLQRQWPRARSLGVLCGVGNNGGDGFVVARLALAAGFRVRVWQVGDAARIRGDALSARDALLAAGGAIDDFDGTGLGDVEVLVDGLLGTGLSGEVDGQWRAAIEVMNVAHAIGTHVLALDIPSGLHADTGRILGVAVTADVCVTFIGLKVGLFTGQGPACCGALAFSDLAVPDTVYVQLTPTATRLSWNQTALPPRSPAAHKGDFGHVLVVGGDRGMSGALQLAGEAALRTGAGLVSEATRAEHAAVISAVRPELMVHGVESVSALSPLFKRATVLAVGPGLGQGEWGRMLFSAVLESLLPMVVDADALNLLAAEPAHRHNWILTPHPGEAARLLGQTMEQVQADRLAAATAIQQQYGGVVLLKGAGTVIVNSAGEIGVCSEGNPGMASGGMGDVLTGVIAGLLAQQCSPSEAATLGVCLHAHAADVAAEDGQRGLLASDLFPVMRQVLG
jgi:NAD(P)H-hydrate epimerase